MQMYSICVSICERCDDNPNTATGYMYALQALLLLVETHTIRGSFY